MLPLALTASSACEAPPAAAGRDAEDADSESDPEADTARSAEGPAEWAGLGLAVEEAAGGTVVDPITGRTLPVWLRYPAAGGGPFPVVIWSPGGDLDAGGHRQNARWGDTIAADGYVVVHVGHVPLVGREERAALCALAAIPREACVDGADPSDPESPFTSVARPRDVIAVLDALPALGERLAELGGPAIDPARVALAGWSAGTRAPMTLLGATRRITPDGPPFALPDPRPLAGVSLSPAGPGYLGFYADGDGTSWDGLRGPTLIATGDNDVKPNVPGLDGPVRRVAFDEAPADGTRWLLYGTLPPGTGAHGTYNLGDLGDGDPGLDALSRALQSAVLAFLDATVRGDPEATAWLGSDRVAEVAAGAATWERR